MTTTETPIAARFGRLAEEAARTGQGPGAGSVERGIAAALSALREVASEVDPRLVAAAADVSRPLPRRVAVLAQLHRVLSGER
jgi:hypothetical protein